MACPHCTGRRTAVLAGFVAGDPKADLRAAHVARLAREENPGLPVHIHYDLRRDSFMVLRDAA